LGAFTLALLLGLAAPASAHAILVASNPGEGARLSAAPAQVVLTFDEPVEIALGALRVFGPDGQRVDVGSPRHEANGDATVVVGLHSQLPHGTYTVAWRVISADSHPVHGAFVFVAGQPSGPGVTAQVNQAGSLGVGIAFGIIRWIAFAAFALLVGSSAFLLWCWPAGADLAEVRRLVGLGWASLLAATLGALGLQGPYGAGLGLDRLWDLATLGATLGTRFGIAVAIRVVLLAVTGVYLGWVFTRLARADHRQQAALRTCGTLLAAGLAATWAAAGHAGVGRQVVLALPLDVLHLLAMATWIGGLVILAGIVLRHRQASVAAQAVPRFSRIALGCVAVLAATGGYQMLRQVETLPALLFTSYGRLLQAKLAGFVVLLALGMRARDWVWHNLSAPARTTQGADRQRTPRSAQTPVSLLAGVRRGRGQQDEPRPLRRPSASIRRPSQAAIGQLRRWVAAEVAVAVVVLALTAVLVNAEPARTAYAAPVSQTVAFDAGGRDGSGTLSLVLDPARTGGNVLHLSVLGANGLPREVVQVQAGLTLPSQDIGPLRTQLVHAGPGHYAGSNLIVPLPGTWQLSISIRTSDIDQTTVTIPVRIR